MTFREAMGDFRRFTVENVRRTGRMLGNGSYGSVEEVEANGLLCAGKILHAMLLDRNNYGVEAVVQRYVQECTLMADLRHPNLVQFLGVCFIPESPTPMLLMEKMDVTLDHVLETRPNIPLSMKRAILTDVSRGLQYLHSHNPPLIHRDITARNVMLIESSMLAKISDFGNSRIVNFNFNSHTLTRAPGTLHYCAPEALSDGARYTAKIDIFSFGHLALFTVTQVYPEVSSATYTSGSRVLARSEVERRQDAIDAMEDQLGGRSHPLAQLTVRCLHNSPATRPTADLLCQELERMRGVIQDVQGDLSRLQLIDMVSQRGDEVRRQEIRIAQLQSQLAQMKSTSGSDHHLVPRGASLQPTFLPTKRSQYSPMPLCDIPHLDCYDDDAQCDPFPPPPQRYRNAYTPPPPSGQRNAYTPPLAGQRSQSSYYSSGSLTPPPNRQRAQRNTNSLPPRSLQGSDQLAAPYRTQISLPVRAVDQQQVSQPMCEATVQNQSQSRNPYDLPFRCQQPVLQVRQAYNATASNLPLQNTDQNSPSVQEHRPIRQFPHPAYGCEESISTVQMSRQAYGRTIQTPRQAYGREENTVQMPRQAYGRTIQMPHQAYGRTIQMPRQAYGHEEGVSAVRMPHPASVPAALASLSSGRSSSSVSQGPPSSSKRSQSLDFSLLQYKAGHMAKNMDFGATLRGLDVYAERMVQCAEETTDGSDEYIAALYRPLCLEGPHTAWKVIFAIFKKSICCGHPLSVYLDSLFGPLLPTTISFQFDDRNRITLQIPADEAEEQGFEVQMDTEVGPCVITKEEADSVSHDFVTYPPRRVLRIRPILLPPISELDITLELQGVVTNEDHPARKFRLTSPELSPLCDLSTISDSIIPEMGQLQRGSYFHHVQPQLRIPNQLGRGAANRDPPPVHDQSPSQPAVLARQNNIDGNAHTIDDHDGVLNREPSVADFMNKIGFEVFQKWEEFGYELGLDRRIIDAVRMNARTASTAQTSIREVYLAWQRTVLTDDRRTWSTVLQALESRHVDERRLARRVRTQLLAPPTADDLV